MQRMAVIGCGNMASPLVEGFASARKSLQLFTYTPSVTRAQELAQRVGGTCCPTLPELPTTDWMIIACKPQQFSALAEALRPRLSGQEIIVSVMAGITISRISEALGASQVIRLMPNTPVKVNKGVHMLYYPPQIAPEARTFLESLLKPTGLVTTFAEEALINAATAHIGSGPAYVFQMASVLIEDLCRRGIEAEQAKAMVNQMILGAATLMQSSELSATELRDQVTSKAGVTAEVLNSLEAKNWSQSMHEALAAGCARADALSS